MEQEEGIALITGHTHQPEFPSPGRTPYFNCGSSVHPRCITSIEIENESIALVKWHVSTPLAAGTGVSSTLTMEREVLEGPVPLEDYVGKRETGRSTDYRRPARVGNRQVRGLLEFYQTQGRSTLAVGNAHNIHSPGNL